MNDLPVKMACPLGVECREVKDNVIHQCTWLVNIQGKHPQSEEVVDEYRCSMAWMPILLVENAQTNRGQTEALEGFRNAMVNQNNSLLNVAIQNKKSTLIGDDNG